MNVCLIAIDTLRADHLSCYGYRRLTSPHIDEIASRGVLFEEFFAPHIPTHPGFTTMFTGKDVFSHQVVAQGGKREPPRGVRMLAQILKKRGYFCACADNMGRWFARGFELRQSYRWERDPGQPWRKGEAVNEAAFLVLEACARRRRPWFAFLHYWDPHTPYLPPPPFSRMFYCGNERDPKNRSMDGVWASEPFRDYFRAWMGGVTDIEFPKAQYDAEIAYCDACLRHVFTRMEKLGLLNDTLLIITADHGEELDEHEMWFDHHGLYDTNLHVPLIMYHRERLPAGKRIRGMARHMDLAPTILDLLGMPDAAEEAQMEGQSLVPWIDGSGEVRVCDELYLTECTWMRKRGIRTRRYKYIHAREPDYHGRPEYELYDLKADPEEQHNLAEERPELVQRMERKLRAWCARRAEETGLPDPIETQGITLRRIGNINVAVPENQKLEK